MILIDYETRLCCECEREYIKTSKTKRLNICEDCQYKNKYGITKSEKLKQRQRELFERMRSRAAEKQKAKNLQLRPKIKPISERQQEKKYKLDLIKREVKMERLNELGLIECAGCKGQFKIENIQASHKSSVGARIDLSHDKANLTPMCHNCHAIWENAPIVEKIRLFCFIDEMKYLYQKDYSKFAKLFELLLNLEDTPKIRRIITQIEAFESEIIV